MRKNQINNMKKILLTAIIALFSATSVWSQQQITFTWEGSASSKNFAFHATEGTNNITVDWGDESAEATYNGVGVGNVVSSHTYGNTNTYTVTITAATGTDITSFSVGDKNVSALDVSGATALQELFCYDNQLTDLNVSNNTALQRLHCHINQLTNLDVSANTALTYLNCNHNQLTALNVSNNTDLTTLFCDNNQLTALDVSANTTLIYLDCNRNQLTALDVSTNTALIDLRCTNNQLTVLDASNKTALQILYCDYNQLTALNVSNNTALKILDCDDNQLTALDVSTCTALSQLNCRNNAIPLTDLKTASDKISNVYAKMFGTQTLPLQRAPMGVAVTLDAVFNGVNTIFAVTLDGDLTFSSSDYTITGGDITFLKLGLYQITITNPGIVSNSGDPAKVIATYDTKQQQITFIWEGSASSKDFLIHATVGTDNITVDWGDGNSDNYNGDGTNNVLTSHTYGNTNTYPVTITATIGTDITYLSVYGMAISLLNVSGAPALTYLDCANNQLTDLDVSNNNSLTYLSCDDNQLTDLDVSNNNSLTYLGCANNQLPNLDVSANTALTALYCHNNAIPLIDLKAASDKISNISDKRLGTQTLPTQLWTANAAVTLDSVFNGAGTNFAVTLNGSSTTSGVDYTITNGDITFLKYGVYQITISNPTGIPSDASYLAQVIATYDVRHQITFTWKGSTSSKDFDIRATADINNIKVDWGDGNSDNYNGNGASDVSPSHTYGNTNLYTVTITVAAGTDITYLNVFYKEVSALDVSGATALQYLNCSENYLPELDVSANTALTYLECNANYLTELDVSTNTALEELHCYVNHLTELDVTANTALTDLSFFHNKLTDLDISNNTLLEYLNCHNNQLAALDLSTNTALTYLECYHNAIPLIDIKAASDKISNVPDKHLGAQFLPEKTEVTNVAVTLDSVFNGGGTIFDVTLDYVTATENTDYTISGGDITFLKNGLYQIDITNPTGITSDPLQPARVVATYNTKQQITFTWKGELYSKDFIIRATAGAGNITIDWGDGSNNTYNGNGTTNVMPYHTYGDTNLYTVTITAAAGTDITYLTIGNKNVFALDVSNATALETLTCWGNPLTTLDVSNNTALTYLDCVENQLTTLDVSNNTALTWLQCRDNQLTALDVSTNTDLEYLFCSNNQLTSLDVSASTDLIRLQCHNNQLTALDVSANNSLLVLYCYNNQLTALDLSINTALTALQCYDNQLTALDLSTNTALTSLQCSDNQLTALDLSANTALTYLRCYTNAIPLIDLKAASDKISDVDYKFLGTQTLPTILWTTNAAVTLDSVFNGVNTTFDVTLDDVPTTSSSDYTISGGDITFLKQGLYQISISNPIGIISEPSYPAKVIARYDTRPQQQITFTWTGSTSSKNFLIQATAGTDNITIDWGDGSSNTYNGNGTTNVSPSHTYGDTNPYIVTITAATGTDITALDASNKEISTLDVSDATALTSLYCYNNAIPLIDLKAASDKISNINDKHLGTQVLPAQIGATNTTVTLDSVFNGAGTYFVVTLNSVAATENTDYTISNGDITFLKQGLYQITISNPTSITSHSGYPAQVISTYNATCSGTIGDYTWQDVNMAKLGGFPYYHAMYPDIAANATKYGLLYDFATAQSICPSGWHLPDSAAITQLILAYTAPDLKATTGEWLYGDANNSSGLTVLPAGMYNASADRYELLRGDAFFWTEDGKVIHLTCGCDDIQLQTMHKTNRVSVRCVKKCE